jgi:DNA-binding XRE family transcriptional regulator
MDSKGHTYRPAGGWAGDAGDRAESREGPIQGADDPIQGAGGPIQGADDPIQGAGGPVRAANEPRRSPERPPFRGQPARSSRPTPIPEPLTDRELMEVLGRRLAVLREARGLTQVEAAERAALSRRTVHRAENGINPTLLTIVRLLRVYGRMDALNGLVPDAPEVSPARRLGRGPH